jgi:hypothetical protein
VEAEEGLVLVLLVVEEEEAEMTNALIVVKLKI